MYYVFYSLATSLRITLVHLRTETLSSGSSQKLLFSKTLSPGITFCCSVARQAEPNITAR
jgi:hypothetical protein